MAFLLLVPVFVIADDPGASEAEKAMIPKWCAFSTYTRDVHGEGYWRQIPDPAIRTKIKALDDARCNGYHHYCWALIWTNRGLINPISEKKENPLFYFEVALDDYLYVLGKSNEKTCPLVVDVHTKIGELQYLRGKPKEAEESFRKALKINPAHAPAYMGLSDLYEAVGASDQAIAILQAGIAANPKSSALRKKLQRVEQRTGSNATQP